MLDLNYTPQAVVDTEGMSNEEWLKYRTTGIGGSDVAAIYGVSPWTTKRALYYAKKKLNKNEDPNPYTLEFGHTVEPFIARAFEMGFEEKYKIYLESKLGVKIRSAVVYKDTVMYRHPLYPFMQANLDYRIKITTDTGVDMEGVFECKTTNYHLGPEKWDMGKVPYEYELQCRHYMSIMNLPFTVIAVSWGNNINDYKVRFIGRDLDEEENMIKMEEDFWINNVLNNNPPPLSKEQAAEELDAFKRYSISDRIKDGSMLEIDTSKKKLIGAITGYAEADEEISNLKRQIKELEKVVNLKKVEILECLAEEKEPNKDRIIRVSENTSFILKNSQTESLRIDSSRLKEELPDIFEKYSKPVVTNRFSVKKI